MSVVYGLTSAADPRTATREIHFSVDGGDDVQLMLPVDAAIEIATAKGVTVVGSILDHSAAGTPAAFATAFNYVAVNPADADRPAPAGEVTATFLREE